MFLTTKTINNPLKINTEFSHNYNWSFNIYGEDGKGKLNEINIMWKNTCLYKI